VPAAPSPGIRVLRVPAVVRCITPAREAAERSLCAQQAQLSQVAGAAVEDGLPFGSTLRDVVRHARCHHSC